MERKLKTNIWKYAVLLIANKRIFVAILGVYYLTIPNVTPVGIGIILLFGSLAGFIFEIPSGYVSDKIGHKTALVLSRIFVFTSTLFFLFASNIIFLILGSALMSIGHAFHSGTGNAFMYETLRGLKREHEYTKVMGKISSIGFAIPIGLTMLIPFFVSISFRVPFLIALILDVVGVVVAARLMVPPVPQKEIDEIKLTNFRQVMKDGYRLKFFVFALFSGIISSVLFGISGFRAPYQMFLEVPVIWFGVLHGVGRIFASLMLAYSGKIREKISLFSFYRLQLILYVTLILLLSFISTWQIVVLIFIVINAFQWGLSRVNNGYLIDIIKTSKFKATLLSTASQINTLIGAVVVVSLGFIIERFSYKFGFLYLGLIFAIVLTALYLYIANKHKEINISVDVK